MKILRWGMAAGLLSLSLTPAFAQTALPSKTVVFLFDGDYTYAQNLSEKIREELSLLIKDRYDVLYLQDQTAGWNPAKAESLLSQFLDDSRIDLVVVFGPFLTQAVKIKIPLAKPVVIASLLDPNITGLPKSAEGTSGTPNLYYAARTQSVDSDVLEFSRIIHFKKIYLLAEDTLKPYVKQVSEQLQEKKLDAEWISASGNPSEILERIDKVKAEALYLAPLNKTSEDHQALLDGINKRKIPTFSYQGYSEVMMGALASRMPKLTNKLARRLALNMDRILGGEDPSQFPVDFEIEGKLLINQRTANQIGLSLPFNVLMEADVLFQGETPASGKLSLQQAVSEALQNNLNFRIIEEQMQSASKNYWLAWTHYLPLIKFRLDYNVYDTERARNSGFDKWNYNYGLSLNQLIFSHPVFFQISNAKKQVKVEELRMDTGSLEITDQTVKAYNNYLRAKALLKVERENLKAIEENLSVAQKKRQTGTGGPEEVYRWEAEQASKRSDILQREASVFQSRVILNQLMNRSQEEIFDEQDVGLETVQQYIGGKTLERFVTNLKTLQVFLDYCVNFSWKESPELKAISLGIEQQANLVKSADGRFFLPEATLEGDVRHEIKDKYYVPPIPNEHDDWEMNLRLSYPLLDRGRRPLDSLQQRDELARLKFIRDLRRQEIERDLRRSAYNIYHSLPSIDLRREAMTASAQEYEIMDRKYQEGIVSYVDLIDAQTEKFGRESDAVISIYDFLDDVSDFDRQLSHYYMLASPEDQKAWFDQVREYLQSKGIA